MTALRRQEGMTMWGMVGLALIGIFFLLLMFKLIPPYMDDFKVGSAIKRIAKKPGAGSLPPNALIENIDKMFAIENVNHVRADKDVEIIPRGASARLIKLEYEREVPMTGNISVLLYFDHAVEAR